MSEQQTSNSAAVCTYWEYEPGRYTPVQIIRETSDLFVEARLLVNPWRKGETEDKVWPLPKDRLVPLQPRFPYLAHWNYNAGGKPTNKSVLVVVVGDSEGKPGYLDVHLLANPWGVSIGDSEHRRAIRIDELVSGGQRNV